MYVWRWIAIYGTLDYSKEIGHNLCIRWITSERGLANNVGLGSKALYNDRWYWRPSLNCALDCKQEVLVLDVSARIDDEIMQRTTMTARSLYTL